MKENNRVFTNITLIYLNIQCNAAQILNFENWIIVDKAKNSHRNMIVGRNLGPSLLESATRFPVLTLTGPRQSGKTTLVKSLFESHAYVTLEAPDEREFAARDPRAFLSQLEGGAIIDEVQYVPDLVSYIQTIVDENPVPGSWILTSSENLTLSQTVSQSLAGRTSVHHLFPLTWDETTQFKTYPENLENTLFTGSFPRIFNENQNPSQWLSSYVHTYVERDVRSLINVGNLITFQNFLRLCAGRSGTLLNYSSLANDCGMTQPTIKHWLSVLEASYIVFRLAPFHHNLRKRLVKMPKLYFYDTGLMCWLLGIREPEQIHLHPQRGQIFETWVVSEFMKHRANSNEFHGTYFYRDHNGVEVDIVIIEPERILLTEAKSSTTPSIALLEGAKRKTKHFQELPQRKDFTVVYGGDKIKEINGDRLIPWRCVSDLLND